MSVHTINSPVPRVLAIGVSSVFAATLACATPRSTPKRWHAGAAALTIDAADPVGLDGE
jgi:hypothetical protein